MRDIAVTVWLVVALTPACHSRQEPAARWVAERHAQDSATIANPPPCNPPPLVDTVGWVRLPRASAPFAILLPPSFTRDTSHTLYFEHGGQRWVDGTREFLEMGGYWGVESFGGAPLCRMPMGGRSALVALQRNGPRRSVSAFWRWGFNTLYTGRVSDEKDLAIMWTVLATMADSTGAVPSRR